MGKRPGGRGETLHFRKTTFFWGGKTKERGEKTIGEKVKAGLKKKKRTYRKIRTSSERETPFKGGKDGRKETFANLRRRLKGKAKYPSKTIKITWWLREGEIKWQTRYKGLKVGFLKAVEVKGGKMTKRVIQNTPKKVKGLLQRTKNRKPIRKGVRVPRGQIFLNER